MSSDHFPPTGDAADLNELAALIESADPEGFLVLDVRFGAASAVLNSEWLKAREAKVSAKAINDAADWLFEELLSRVDDGMVVRPNVIPELLRDRAKAVADG